MLKTSAPVDVLGRTSAEVGIKLVDPGRCPSETAGGCEASSKGSSRGASRRRGIGGEGAARGRKRKSGDEVRVGRGARAGGKAKAVARASCGDVVASTDSVTVGVHHAVAGADDGLRIDLVGDADPGSEVLEVVVDRCVAVACIGAGACELQRAVNAGDWIG